MEIIATDQAIGLADLGPQGLAVLLAVAAVLLLNTKRGRAAVKAALRRAGRAVVRFVRIGLWAARLRMPIRLAYRLQPDRWLEMCSDRKMVGLKRGKVRRTPMGVDVMATLNGALRLDTLVARIPDLETGLGVRRGSIRVEGRDSAHKATIRITVRDPLAKPIPWAPPAGPVSIADPVRLAVTPFGDAVEVDLMQRILIVGASGSGKSSVQRVLSAPVIQAPDAELEVWDLKQGTESQHYAGKADLRITTADQARERIDWFMGSELPRRAAVMRSRKTSTWPTSPQHPVRIVQVDEGAALIRELDEDELRQFFTFLEQARAFGIYVWWATQFPKSTNLPTELRSQMQATIALKMKRVSESRVVFEDLTKDGWTPHRLPGPGWLMVSDDDHQEPDPGRALWLDERRFRTIQATMPTPPPVTLTKPATAPRTAPEPSARPTVAQDARTALLSALAAATEDGASVADLQEATGLSKSRVYELLPAMAVKVRHGRWVVAQVEKETAA